MRIQIILAFATIAVCLFGIAAQFYRLARRLKEWKKLEQDIDELIKEIEDETIHNNRPDRQAD